MGKFLRKRGAAVITSLALCASLVAPSFAASFNQLQGVIDNKKPYSDESGNVLIGYDKGTVTLYDHVTRVEGEQTDIKINGDKGPVILDLNGYVIDGHEKESNSSIIELTNGGNLTLKDSKGTGEAGKITGAGHAGIWVDKSTFTMEGGTITDNVSGRGGGVHVQNGGSFTMKGGEISGNYAKAGQDDGNGIAGGGGVYVERGSSFTMNGGNISGNTASGCGANVLVDGTKEGQSQFVMTGGTVGNSEAKKGSISVIGNGSQFVIDGEAKVDGSIFASQGAQITGNNGASKDGRDFDGFTVNGTVHVGKGDTYTADEESRLDVRFEEQESGERPVTPGGSETPSEPDEPDEIGEIIEIEDEAVPLAGLFTRADAIGYLWQRSGSPDAALSDFVDVPEDHDWAVAIGWAEQNGIAVADEEGGFRPDDLLLRGVEDILLAPEGELEEFLNRYAVSAGVKLGPDELFIELDGEPDDIVMGEDAQVIFDDFFARLEAR